MPNKNNSFKSALNYDSRILTHYKYQLDIQEKLLKTVKSSLPDKLSRHLLSCVVSEKKIILYTNSAAWSSQLRFYHQTMFQTLLATNHVVFDSLQIKIIPLCFDQIQRKPAKIPSKENIKYLINQADNQLDDRLKKSLLKLGETFKQLSKSNI